MRLHREGSVDWKVKAGRIIVVILDWVCVGCVIYTLIYGIRNHITTGVPFDDNVIQWVLWLGWAFWAAHNPVKRIFGGHKVNG